MRSLLNRTTAHTAATIAALVLASGLAACGGGNGSAALRPAMALESASGTTYALGLSSADPADLAQMTQIRHELSTVRLPPAVDLSGKMPAVGNQGPEQSCVAWATAYAVRGYQARLDVWSAVAPKSTAPSQNFSPSFIYNQINGGHDGGSSIPTALSVLQKKGAATLADMPYVAGQFTKQPSAAAVADAAHYKLASFGTIAPGDLGSMKAQLAKGLPIVLAINVYANFFTLRQNQVYTGISGAYQGGHALTIVGYDDSKQAVEVINSWGTSWGSAGYGWISYSALKTIAVEAYSAIDTHGAPIVIP